MGINVSKGFQKSKRKKEKERSSESDGDPSASLEVEDLEEIDVLAAASSHSSPQGFNNSSSVNPVVSSRAPAQHRTRHPAGTSSAGQLPHQPDSQTGSGPTGSGSQASGNTQQRRLEGWEPPRQGAPRQTRRPRTPATWSTAERLRALELAGIVNPETWEQAASHIQSVEQQVTEDVYEFVDLMAPSLHLISQEALGGRIDDLDRADQAYVRIAECVTSCRRAIQQMDRTKQSFETLLEYVGLTSDAIPDETVPNISRTPSSSAATQGQLVPASRTRRVRSASVYNTQQRALENQRR